ncbi:MAG TPA: ABC transporter permease [Thermoanaerobaculia bacterium]
MGDLTREVRLAVRSLAASPGFTFVAILSLALGIGANTAIFSLVDAVLLRPLPYRQPERLVVLWERNIPRHRDKNVVSPGNFLDWKSRNAVFEDMALSSWTLRTILTGGEPEQLAGRSITPNLFPLLGASPALGRGFQPEDAVQSGAPTPIVIGWGLWQRRFGGDRSVVGRAIRTGDGLCVVVGVMPKGFRPLGTEDYWEPFVFNAQPRENVGRYAVGWGRLKPGVSVESAQASMSAIARALEAQHPEFDAGWTVQVVPLRQEVVGDARTMLLLLLATVSLVLLIACANLASLVLSRAAGRGREVAIRLALGASRAQVARHALVESVVLSLAGGLAGLVAARWALDVLAARAASEIPRIEEVALNGRAVGVAFAMAVAAGILFGLIPFAGRPARDAASALRGESRATAGGRTVKLRAFLAAGQIALAMVLTAGTFLLVRSLSNLREVEPGFESARVLTFRVILPDRYAGEKGPRFFEELVERIRPLPGVAAAAAGSSIPLGGLDVATSYRVAGRPALPAGQKPAADVRRIDDAYFGTLGISLARGRSFSSSDRAGSPPVAVVNRALVRAVFASSSENPIGARLDVNFSPLPGPVEIVGVVGDVHARGLDEDARPTIYVSQRQSPSSMMTIAVRGERELPRMAPLRDALRQLDPEVAPDKVAALGDLLKESLGGRRFPMYFLAPFSATALLLAAVGVYGILSLAVAQRYREIGIRMALGAQSRDVVRLVLSRAARVVAFGGIAGVALALAGARAIRSLLFGVSPGDPLTFAAAAATVLAAALAAAWLPAQRAAKADPVAALRQEGA